MTTISSTSSTTAGAGSTAATSDKKANNQLDQADFLRLLTTQLQNQDPTKPLDGQQFMAQLAQFSTLNAIIEMKASLDTLVQSLEPNTAITADSAIAESANNSTVAVTDAGSQ